MQPKKVLLVGSSFSAAPIFFALKKYGYHVSVCGNNRADPCHQYADASYFLDYSQPDVLLELVKSHNFDYIVPSCNDYSYMSSAYVASKLKFPGFDELSVSKTIHTKNTFRKLTAELNIPSPHYKNIYKKENHDYSDLAFPILVKPTDSFSGKGMMKVLSPEMLSEAVSNAQQTSRSGEVVLEEFKNGSLHSHSAWLKNGSVDIDFFVDEYCTVYPYQVNCSNHPSILSQNIKENIRTSINHIAQTLCLTDGLIHTQFMVSGSEFWIIETMRRCPGDLYGTLIKKSTGFDYIDFYIRPFIDKSLPSYQQDVQCKPYGRHTISSAKSLVYFSFSYTFFAKQVDVIQLKGSGEFLDKAPFDKLGILFAEFNDNEAMLTSSPKFAQFIEINKL